MWTPATRAQHSREGLRYQTDLTDAEWAVIAPHSMNWQNISRQSPSMKLTRPAQRWTLLRTSPILDFFDSLRGNESEIGRWISSRDFSTSTSV